MTEDSNSVYEKWGGKIYAKPEKGANVWHEDQSALYEELSIDRLVKKIKEAARQFPDLRTGKNTQYEMGDAVMGAFSVFITQCASFLNITGALLPRIGGVFTSED